MKLIMAMLVGFFGLFGLLTLVSFDPITIGLIMAGLAAAGAIAVIYVAILIVNKIREWFVAHRQLNRKQIAFAILRAKEENKVRYVQGFFDTETKSIANAQGYRTDQIAADVEHLHEGSEVVIFNS